MGSLRRLAVTCALGLGLAGCATQARTIDLKGGEQLTVSGLGPCDDEAGRPAELDPEQPLVVLVHGCNSSAGRFKTLSRVFEQRGQQTLCFSYDDRDRLEQSARELRGALASLRPRLASGKVTVLGHSQGGLVARRALSLPPGEPHPLAGLELRLVTVSSPFSGIEASSHCGSVLAHVLTLGITTGVCQLVTGTKWMEITPGSRFLSSPGALLPMVGEHLWVVTDERDSCRERSGDGECAEDDYVFSLAEQYSKPSGADPRVSTVEVKAGHVEIVGETGEPPTKLIELLEKRTILAEAPPQLREAYARLLVELYR